ELFGNFSFCRTKGSPTTAKKQQNASDFSLRSLQDLQASHRPAENQPGSRTSLFSFIILPLKYFFANKNFVVRLLFTRRRIAGII
ncbi:MAG: hypothetical protein LBR93_08205, partial [Treponema sp.]|nr:hypothetical protein [Treponema sp.]